MAIQGPIIVVEDDDDDREILIEVFESLGIKNEVKFFSNGEEVLSYLQATTDQPFIIITDVNLPRMGGAELAGRLHEDPYLRKKSIPFIFLTTCADPGAVNKAYEMMIQGYFQKEHNFQQVKNMIKLIMDYWSICKHPNNV
jgi:CheY-like chemotaxis protein